ncbi:MAG: hypothetical protein QNJ22_05565 [Desulfosarcinaceae bacterium]|nr:hypothetical protein [Desulfosarcinaceae bacterium]
MILTVSAAVTVLAVRFLLMRGIDRVCLALQLSNKTRGQLVGYVTSVPEFTIVVAAGLSGVFDAGFWNIASSNIINFGLFLIALFAYGQHRDLLSLQLLDEVGFGVLSIAVPLAMHALAVTINGGVALLLLAFFGLYKLIDLRLNRPVRVPEAAAEPSGEGPLRGMAAILVGVLIVLVAGRFLGSSAHALIVELKMPSWIVGWVLGFITSLPEAVSFFEIFRLEKQRGRLHRIDDAQQGLDALVASNMSNLGLILPAGMGVYVLAQ